MDVYLNNKELKPDLLSFFYNKRSGSIVGEAFFEQGNSIIVHQIILEFKNAIVYLPVPKKIYSS